MADVDSRFGIEPAWNNAGTPNIAQRRRFLGNGVLKRRGRTFFLTSLLIELIEARHRELRARVAPVLFDSVRDAECALGWVEGSK